jgi:hypothetical protein
MQAHYSPLIQWFDGIPLNAQLVDSQTGETIDRYPIKLNPIPGTCQKHAAVLLGNTLESIREGGLPIQFVPKSDLDEPDGPEDMTAEQPEMDEMGRPKPPPLVKPKPKKQPKSEKVVEAIRKAFEYAGGGAMFADSAVSSQYLGGSVWKVKFDKDNEDYPIQVNNVDPTEFLGIPKGGNHWEFHEAWFVREISIYDAKARGYAWNGMDEQFFYLEHWTNEDIEVLINEQTIQKEPNVFGVIPFVYIPHVRIRSFIGKSIITETVKGLIKEWNLRFGDVGDAVSDDAHAILAVRGVRGNLATTKLSDGRVVVNLGSKSGLSNSETDPDMIAIKTQVTSEPMIKLNQMLEGQYRKEVNHPAVADGEDEGSQRSAATLTVRMWPLISHVEIERINWTVGMLKLAKIILRFYAVKSVDGITEDEIEAGFTIKWSSSLPRDREALITELAVRKKNGMSSLHHLLNLLGDVEDIDKEIQMIEDEVTRKQGHEMALLEAKSAAQPAPFGGNGGGNKDGKNNQEKGDKTSVNESNNLPNEEKQQ